MSLLPNTDVDVTIEKPAAGGRMLARHDGQVVFVLGAIPGERVRVHVERVTRQLGFAEVIEVLVEEGNNPLVFATGVLNVNVAADIGGVA